jgi:hypothetical protein
LFFLKGLWFSMTHDGGAAGAELREVAQKVLRTLEDWDDAEERYHAAKPDGRAWADNPSSIGAGLVRSQIEGAQESLRSLTAGLRAALREPPPQEEAINRPDLDEQRWKVIEEALTTKDLTSDLSRLAAIGAVVNSRTPLTAEEIAESHELLGDELTPTAASARLREPQELKTSVNDVGDTVCEHGTAMDVHCCGCHSGFLFDSRKCTCF